MNSATAMLSALTTADMFLIFVVPSRLSPFVMEADMPLMFEREAVIARLGDALMDNDWSARVIHLSADGKRTDISEAIAHEWAAKLKRCGEDEDTITRNRFISEFVSNDALEWM